MVRDPAVDVHAAVVVEPLVELVHVRRLVAALGVDEAARVALREHLRPDDLLADQPVVAVDHRRHHVGEALVERARLALIDEVDRAGHDRVRELVGRHVERPREAP
jgi:hypothetical protein